MSRGLEAPAEEATEPFSQDQPDENVEVSVGDNEAASVSQGADWHVDSPTVQPDDASGGSPAAGRLENTGDDIEYHTADSLSEGDSRVSDRPSSSSSEAAQAAATGRDLTSVVGAVPLEQTKARKGSCQRLVLPTIDLLVDMISQVYVDEQVAAAGGGWQHYVGRAERFDAGPRVPVELGTRGPSAGHGLLPTPFTPSHVECLPSEQGFQPQGHMSDGDDRFYPSFRHPLDGRHHRRGAGMGPAGSGFAGGRGTRPIRYQYPEVSRPSESMYGYPLPADYLPDEEYVDAYEEAMPQGHPEEQEVYYEYSGEGYRLPLPMENEEDWDDQFYKEEAPSPRQTRRDRRQLPRERREGGRSSSRPLDAVDSRSMESSNWGSVGGSSPSRRVILEGVSGDDVSSRTLGACGGDADRRDEDSRSMKQESRSKRRRSPEAQEEIRLPVSDRERMHTRYDDSFQDRLPERPRGGRRGHHERREARDEAPHRYDFPHDGRQTQHRESEETQASSGWRQHRGRDRRSVRPDTQPSSHGNYSRSKPPHYGSSNEHVDERRIAAKYGTRGDELRWTDNTKGPDRRDRQRQSRRSPIWAQDGEEGDAVSSPRKKRRLHRASDEQNDVASHEEWKRHKRHRRRQDTETRSVDPQREEDIGRRNSAPAYYGKTTRDVPKSGVPPPSRSSGERASSGDPQSRRRPKEEHRRDGKPMKRRRRDNNSYEEEKTADDGSRRSHKGHSEEGELACREEDAYSRRIFVDEPPAESAPKLHRESRISQSQAPVERQSREKRVKSARIDGVPRADDRPRNSHHKENFGFARRILFSSRQNKRGLEGRRQYR